MGFLKQVRRGATVEAKRVNGSDHSVAVAVHALWTEVRYSEPNRGLLLNAISSSKIGDNSVPGCPLGSFIIGSYITHLYVSQLVTVVLPGSRCCPRAPAGAEGPPDGARACRPLPACGHEIKGV